MALEATFRELTSELRKLHDTLIALRLTVVEDKPLKGEAALVDYFEDSILDLLGLLNESMRAARTAQKTVEQEPDLNAARRALNICQDRVHRIEQQFAADMVSYEKLKDLAGLGSSRRGEWLPWSNSVKQGIEQCRPPLEGAVKAMAACWQEIAERVGTTSLSVRTTNIGQKIVTKSAEAADMAAEGIG